MSWGASEDHRATVVSTGRKRRAEVVAKTLARYAGLDVSRAKLPSEDRRRRQLMARRNVDLVLDVGANEGQFARCVRVSGYAGRIVSFEPLRQPYDRLLQAASPDPAWECRRVALGETTHRGRINVASDSKCSSLLPATGMLKECLPQAETLGDEEIDVVCLAELADDLDLARHVALLKMDVQGYERQVLAGARAVLDTIPLLELELSVHELYAEQAQYLEMLGLIDELGYRPAVIWEEFVDHSTGAVQQFNVIAARE